MSDRSSAGVRADRSGPLAAELLAAAGVRVDEVVVVPDDAARIGAELRRAGADGVALVVTTGGTGLSPRDVTPEATRAVVDREIPGIAEAIRAVSQGAVPASMLSRAVAGALGPMLVVNLPGSPGGVRDGLAVLAPVLAHAVGQLQGGDDHGPG